MEKDEEITFTRGSDNIFLDIGFPPEQAAELLVKSNMIMTVEETINHRRLTQKQAAALCHTDQPTLSKALRGHLLSVTIDRLASWLTLLGCSVEIHLKSYDARRKQGRLTAFSDRKAAKRPRAKATRSVA